VAEVIWRKATSNLWYDLSNKWENSYKPTLQWAKFLPTPLLLATGDRDTYLIQCSLDPKSLDPKEDLDPFSRFCRSQARDRLTDRHTMLQITDRNRLYLMHLTWSNNVSMYCQVSTNARFTLSCQYCSRPISTAMHFQHTNRCSLTILQT